ncbi:MAG: DUF6978 family protein [Pseudonocardiaceae bacterium]
MLEQWQADRLLGMRKVYTVSLAVDTSPGADHDYQVESDDETEFFLFDVRRSRRNPRGFRVQLRYQRDIVLARFCLSTPHTNPDGEHFNGPHFHQYREEFGDKWATPLPSSYDIVTALEYFCDKINLPSPEVRGR